MPKTLPFISYKTENKSPVVDSPNAFYQLSMYKSEDYFMQNDSMVKFTKGVEKKVRENDRYKKYIAYLKSNVKLNRCQVLRDITDEDATIEMHHGIINLFNICDIVTQYFLLHNWPVSTFRIADAVLDEHYKNRIPVIMVSVTVHQQIHNGTLFIPYKAFFGDFKSFIRKYDKAISQDIREVINRYIDRSLIEDPENLSILDLNPQLKKK